MTKRANSHVDRVHYTLWEKTHAEGEDGALHARLDVAV